MNPIVIAEIFDACVNIAQVIQWISGSDAKSDTAITWGNVVAGDCWYYYLTESGQRIQEHASYCFDTAVSDGYALISGEHVMAVARYNGATSGSAPGVAFLPDRVIKWYAQNMYYVTISINGTEHTVSELSLNYPSYNSNYPVYDYMGDSSQRLDNCTAVLDSAPSFTTMSQGANSGAVYIPISGKTLSYDDILPYLIQWADEQPTETDENGETYAPITIDDLPTWNDIAGTTEPVEPGYGNIYIDNVNISGNADIDIDAQADINLNFDADADINVVAGAGAYVSGEISGSIDVGGITGNVEFNGGDVNLQGGDINLTGGDVSFSGEFNNDFSLQLATGDVNISGDNVTINNYGESIDYAEIMSPSEFRDVLDYTDYQLDEIETDAPVLTLDNIPALEALPAEIIQAVPMVLKPGLDTIDTLGLTSIFISLGVVSVLISIFVRR